MLRLLNFLLPILLPCCCAQVNQPVWMQLLAESERQQQLAEERHRHWQQQRQEMEARVAAWAATQPKVPKKQHDYKLRRRWR
jgi:lipase chaperone LimK